MFVLYSSVALIMTNPLFQMENIISGVRDTNLKLTLAFGIGIHHAGLIERDRKITEELFVNSKIQVETGRNLIGSSLIKL